MNEANIMFRIYSFILVVCSSNICSNSLGVKSKYMYVKGRTYHTDLFRER